jgi:Haem-binding domain
MFPVAQTRASLVLTRERAFILGGRVPGHSDTCQCATWHTSFAHGKNMVTKTSPAFRAFTWLVGASFIGFLVIQFIRPTLTNPPVTADLQAPPQVKQILKNSCYNCQSNETKLSWFDKPAPAYWTVARDVRAARNHINFSEIGKLSAGQQRAAHFEGVFGGWNVAKSVSCTQRNCLPTRIQELEIDQ